MAQRILLIEDEPGLVLTIGDRLRGEGYDLVVAATGTAGLARAADTPFDLIVLDLGLPDMSGLDVCRRLRQRGDETPIIMLTAWSEVADRVVGLKAGADDYLTKPFSVAELLARIEVVLRRASRAPARSSTTYCFGDVQVDLLRPAVYRAGALVELSALEFRLLRYFVEHPGVTISRDELLNQVWGYDKVISTRTVDVHVAWLRQKLEANPRQPQFILTAHGIGYRFVG